MKRIWLLVPAVLLPYLALGTLAVIFFSDGHPALRFVMESVFRGDALFLIASLLIVCLIAFVFAVFYFVAAIRGEWDALTLARTAMVIKLIQIPGYIGIFVFGVLLVITVFTVGFSVGLFLVDCLTVLLSGLAALPAVVNGARGGILSAKKAIWLGVLQFVFCADVAAAIVLFRTLKEKDRSQPDPIG